MGDRVKVYEWVRKPNWGDRLTGTILRGLDMEPHLAPVSEADLVMVGSVLEHLPPWWNGTVAGAGKLFRDSYVNLSHATVLAVRGRLTAENTVGVPRDAVLGDPGLLTPRFVSGMYAKYDLGVLPHWSDTTLKNKYANAYYIDPSKPPEYVAQEITRCKRLITSGLHGVIIADAYGIPRQSELFPQSVNEGEDFKFRDYASAFDGDPHFGEMYTAPFDEVERVQANLLPVMEQLSGQQLVYPDVPDPHEQIWCNACWPQISILVPFRDDNEHRRRVWHWLRRYWKANLKSVEIIQGHYAKTPFSKTQAINYAAEKAKGRVFVLADCDCYINANVIQSLADQIDRAVSDGKKLWFMPYSRLYRITREPTLDLLETDPTLPYQMPSPPPDDWIEPDNSANYGHKFGALIQVMPREAFYRVRGMDPRYNKGWGSEDASMMRSVDTLYQEHQVVSGGGMPWVGAGDVCHLWHIRPGSTWRTRRWVGQINPAGGNTGVALPRLAQRYSYATGEPGFMDELVNEHPAPGQTWVPQWAWLYRKAGWPGYRFPWLRPDGGDCDTP